MRLTIKILAFVVPTLAFVLGIVTLLTYFKGQSLLADTVEQRASVILQDARSSLESGLALGLHLGDLETASVLVARAKARDDYIKGVYVFGTDGRIVFATDPAAVGTVVQAGWQSAQAHASKGAWKLTSPDGLVLGQRLESNISRDVGGLALTYSLQAVKGKADAMLWGIVKAALLILAAAAVLAAAGIYLVSNSFQGTFRELSKALDRADDEGAAPDGRLPPPLRLAAERFRAALAEAGRSLGRIESSVPEGNSAVQSDAPRDDLVLEPTGSRP